ncbi:MAG: hypothetical protein ACHQ2Y_07625 [Candidatus Lutacidiplasmatales archaeon]
MELARLFGSRVRAQTLQALAATSQPMTAYRLSRAIEAQPIQVLTILKSLRPMVERVREGWVLRDDHLRSFLLSELREKDRARREEKDVLLARIGLRPSLEHGPG